MQLFLKDSNALMDIILLQCLNPLYMRLNLEQLNFVEESNSILINSQVLHQFHLPDNIYLLYMEYNRLQSKVQEMVNKFLVGIEF